MKKVRVDRRQVDEESVRGEKDGRMTKVGAGQKMGR